MMLTMYTKTNCPYCVKSKALLTSAGVEFEEINIEQDTTAREKMMSEGHRTVPQIYLGDNLFVEGGYHGLSKLTTDEIKDRINLTNNLGTI